MSPGQPAHSVRAVAQSDDQPDDKSVGGDSDVRRVEIFLDPLEAALAPEPARLHAPERRGGVGDQPGVDADHPELERLRSEEHTSAIPSLMRISYAGHSLHNTAVRKLNMLNLDTTTPHNTKQNSK